ncbi:MAG: ABC transporter substrate-binding protein [Armatimonadota bacterium]
MGRIVIVAMALVLAAGVMLARGQRSIVIGAVYPTGGGQGPGGVEEYRGVSLAAAYARLQRSVNGRSITVRLEQADSREAAPGAVARLAQAGATIVVGSYGSTISRPAADAASRLGLVFWETGAVGELSMAASKGERIFRFAPTGGALGRSAVAFIRDQITPHIKRARPLRYTVAYVDDVYGRSVGLGAIAEIRESGLPFAAALPYELIRVNYDRLAAQVAQARTDVLVVAAYLDDGVALRRAVLHAKVPLVASIGTSSSFCMPEFGQKLGPDAVGLFASDKPDGDVFRTDRLSPEAAEALRWARDEYRRLYGAPMSAPALSGFAGGWALFGYVLPRARDLSPDAVAEAARAIRLPLGSLPNGSGLAFAPVGHPEGGANLFATSVIWEWVRPNTRAVVWPASFATHPIVFPRN